MAPGGAQSAATPSLQRRQRAAVDRAPRATGLDLRVDGYLQPCLQLCLKLCLDLRLLRLVALAEQVATVRDALLLFE